MGANCKTINTKKASIAEIMKARRVDIGVFSKLNCKNPPKIIGFTTFSKISKRKFHGIRVYVRNHLRGNVLRIPDEVDELEVVHIIIKNTTPVCKFFVCYLDVESRYDQDKISTSRVWQKLGWKIDTTIERGEGDILIGDLNRPLQAERLSFGTRLYLSSG